jgi:polysaccharide deacetylase family protein (PEP-CTERM system associated)
MTTMRDLTFTLDLEDHRADASSPARFEAPTRRVLDLLAARGVRGSFFVTGDVAEQAPGLVRDIARAGHELGFHGWDHTALTELAPDRLRDEATRGKQLLEDLGERPVSGFRAPMFSLVPSSRWALDVLVDVGYTYSSSVLPAHNPLFGDATLPARPFRWPNGLVELPCPVARVGGVGLPYLGGVYFRTIPTVVARGAHRVFGGDQFLWVYCHPYDFDPDEPFWQSPELGRIGNRLLWFNRRHMFAKIDALLAHGAAPPLGERVTTLDPPIHDPVARGPLPRA